MKRRVESNLNNLNLNRGALPSEKVSIWHRDIFMVTPRRMKGVRGASGGSGTGGGQREHPRSCVCATCLAQYGTYHYYQRAMHERRRSRRGNSSSSGVKHCFIEEKYSKHNYHYLGYWCWGWAISSPRHLNDIKPTLVSQHNTLTNKQNRTKKIQKLQLLKDAILAALDFGCWKLDILILEMVIAGPRCDRWLRPWTLSDNWQQLERKKVPQGSTRGGKVPQGFAIWKKVP